MEMHEQQELAIEENKLRKVNDWSAKEKILIVLSVAIAFFFDRLMTNSLEKFVNGLGFHAVFWLFYLAGFYAFFWKRVKRDPVLWVVSACVVALCVWNFIPFGRTNWEFYFLTALVIPGVLMAHAQWSALGLSWKKFDGAVYSIFAAWFEGWFLKPFSAIPEFFGVTASMISEENKPVLKRVAQGLLIVFFMMLVIIPLLMGADMVFGYYVRNFFESFSVTSLIFHGISISIATLLFYSFFWNIGYGDNRPHELDIRNEIDKIISTIILGSTILIYTLFCTIQFTYLFARTGLPSHLTYSEYAREGFAQTVAICTINLFIYITFLWRGEKRKSLTVLLGILLALTACMLFSGALRLSLYIETYGMTWLRLLSAWFIIYLAAVTILSAVRLFKKNLPLVGICALLLLIWYVALGFLNPDGFIHWYNIEMEFPIVVPIYF
jgi:hypothetical protein